VQPVVPVEQKQRLQREQPNRAPRRRVRHLPAAVKREVFVRDEGRCSYLDERGERCRETSYLELHHLQPFARGGQHIVANLALRCAAHNALAAEKDFGRSNIERKRHGAKHESLASHERPLPADRDRGAPD
jgi:5-methylcytosine-specific restriction endonuclease McrA